MDILIACLAIELLVVAVVVVVELLLSVVLVLLVLVPAVQMRDREVAVTEHVV